MTTHVAGQKLVSASQPLQTPHRRNLMDLLAAAPVITDEEYERAVQNILACQDVATLQKWYRNTVREIARREEEVPAIAPVQYATPAQTDEIHKLSLHRVVTKAERTAAILDLPRLDYTKAALLIGELWAKILHRTKQGVPTEGETSFSSAA